MGFTPWPYEATLTAINDSYLRIQNSGDIVAHHLMDGIPWQTSYTGSDLPASVVNNITLRLAHTQSSKLIYLAIDSLNANRNGLALNWGDNYNESLPEPWDTHNFNDPKVISAYSHFALEMINRFNPRFFNYASEISELILNDPVKFKHFTSFAKAVYNNIKTVHPDLQLLVSIAVKNPDSIEAKTINKHFKAIIDYVDIVGIVGHISCKRNMPYVNNNRDFDTYYSLIYPLSCDDSLYTNVTEV